MLSFTLLGPVVLEKNGEPLTNFRSQKEAALLIYLAHSGQAHPRDFIAELLWDSRSTEQALSNLRTALTRLRKQVGDALLVERKSLALTPENRQAVDSVVLLQTVNGMGQIESAEESAALQEALDAYHGDFLADFFLHNAPRFDEWVLTTREHIRQQVISAYDKLGQYALFTKDAETGIAVARRWLQVDKLDEAAHTLLIQLLIEAGDVRAAAIQYNQCVDLLRTELDVAPPAVMTALIRDSLPSRTIPAHQTTIYQPPGYQPSIQHTTPAVLHNIPPAYDQFFGRQTAQQEIHARLDQPWCRLVTIVGQGGVGKTRLATTVARNRLSKYRDGVWLVELADVDPADDDLAEAIAVEIASILDLRLTGAATPVEQLITHLQHKELLLVLDNFELLLGGVQLILDIAQRCENVQLLVTSREALRVRAEWTIALDGLSFPTSDRDDLPTDAVDLFTARRSQQQWATITDDDLAAIHTICRTVEGLPLAIELAAALTRDATPRAIADRLRDGFAALTTTLRDVPQRHRGLHIVFEISWRTLTPAIQLRLAHLSLFRGGFTVAAAHQVAEADAQHLDALSAKSLLSYSAATDRYAIHPVIRAYAAEKRGGRAHPELVEGCVRAATDPILQRHAHYYLTLLAEHGEALAKEAPQQSVAVIQPDIDNVRLAWQTGLAQRQADLLAAALKSLSIYYQLRGLAREGEAAMQATGHTAERWGATGIALATRAGLEQARFQNRLGRYRAAIQMTNTALRLAEQCTDRWAQGMGHILWAEALWRLGEYEAATNKLTHALTIAQALDDTLLIGWCHHHLGIIDDIQSRYTAAHDHLQQACAAWRAIDNVQALSNSLNSIGLVCYNQGDLPAAQQALEQALSLCDQLDNRHLRSLLLNNLSMIATEQGDYLSAHHYLQLGLDLANANGDLAAQGLVHTNLGKNYSLLGESDLAVESLEQGLQISESIGNRSLMAIAIFELAETKRKQGDATRAKSLYRQALELARQDNLQHIACEVLIALAEFLSKNDEREARQYSAQAIVLAEALQNAILLERANAIDHYVNISVDVNEKQSVC